ncbi:cytochrome C peroxidase [Elizabethkingia meningoseptica]|uniref:cytochrome-c peroxidase n=1 Tax=Elizabethkingia meningoseptica TaxID=238 RepID=UPI0022F1ABF6|nr:cytochrome c peroxidase [Elizabethkingia meningoseptica]EJK5327999.1 cytochrome C peroxidase [Elizabethkingia meningoseptica]MDE5466648.1 cytochrome C peroxidase [Elizabethkingia meningoseptica]MDE5474122.1 cytochrome C peroxidase [Elizabethkingia meningoseptica]MDE5477555.1 cytochrome C peroxidase [Elizabethkingia meningoseptica]MDE5483967.1 cytochrome C peroxidase [Elizabethkingia meningoseptica]
MKKLIPLLSVLLLLIVSSCQKNNPEPVSEHLGSVQKYVLEVNSNFQQKTQQLITAVQKDNTDVASLQKQFDDLRAEYKKMEWAVAYFQPHTERFVNGPALDEVEFEENTILEAEGLQVLEEYFYPEYQKNNKEEVLRYLKKLQNKSTAIETYFDVNQINLSQVFDALRSEVFRITTLGVTGFDTPVSGNAISEVVYSLQGIESAFKILDKNIRSKNELKTLLTAIEQAKAFIEKSGYNRNEFDYLTFINQHLNVISERLFNLKNADKIPNVEVKKVIKDTAPTIFAQNAFNADAFVPGEEYKLTEAKINLGKKLFYEKRLSGNNQRACVSCHLPEKAFTDGLPKSASLEGSPLLRNAPSLNYANFQHGQFWDMRREDLEGQSVDVISNKEEMHGNLKDILVKLNQDRAYTEAFKKVYPAGKGIEDWQVKNALASYIRSLSVFNSRFDQQLRGKEVLTKAEKEGFNLFVGKGKCATCHFIPLFNGTVPPEFSKTESEVLGVAENSRNKKLDTDPGRGRFHETVDQLKFAFKTPTLRNIAKTAPYMHNGGYPTLMEVMDFYNQGGGKGFGFKLDNQTLSEDKLNLTPEEKNKIISFMEALTDE